MQVWEALVRVVVAFAALLLWSRIIGKKLISHMTFFDFVAGVTFGSIGGNLIFNRMVPLWIGALSVSVFSLLTLFTDYISLKSLWGRKLFQGKSQIIINNGRMIEKALQQTRLTVDDVVMLLRKKDIFNLQDIECAYFETDGTLSVLKKPTALPVTCGQLGMQPPSCGIPETCIMDGRIMDEGLHKIGKDRDWLNRKLQEKGILADDVLLAQINPSEEWYVSFK